MNFTVWGTQIDSISDDSKQERPISPRRLSDSKGRRCSRRSACNNLPGEFRKGPSGS
jgi:hypothetical protein